MSATRTGRAVAGLLAVALLGAVLTKRAELLVRPWFAWVFVATALLLAAVVVRTRIRVSPASAALLLLPVAVGVTLTPVLASRVSAGTAQPTTLAARIGDGSNPLLGGGGGAVTLLQILLAEQQVGGVALAGRLVQVEAVVGADHTLTRSVIVCCAADAQTVDLPESGPDLGPTGRWVRVTGRLAPVGTQLVLAATSVTTIPTPAEPFL